MTTDRYGELRVPAPAGEAPSEREKLAQMLRRCFPKAGWHVLNYVEGLEHINPAAETDRLCDWLAGELLATGSVALYADGKRVASGAPGRDAPQSDTLVTDEEAKAVREIVQRQDALNDPYAWHRGIEWLLAERRGGLPAAPPESCQDVHRVVNGRCENCGVTFSEQGQGERNR